MAQESKGEYIIDVKADFWTSMKDSDVDEETIQKRWDEEKDEIMDDIYSGQHSAVSRVTNEYE